MPTLTSVLFCDGNMPVQHTVAFFTGQFYENFILFPQFYFQFDEKHVVSALVLDILIGTFLFPKKH